MAAALLASSSVVANPLIIFCRFTGGGVGGRDAGGVGGLLKLLCCRSQEQCNVKHTVPQMHLTQTHAHIPLCLPGNPLVR